MTADEITTVLAEHRRWVAGEGGKRAYLTGAYLAGANLAGAYLTDANLAGANLTDANLTDANLAGAYLAGANLTDAYLAGAYLAGANLTDANLTDANLNWQSHDLLGAVLQQAAGDNLAHRMVAGLLLASRDWCWEQFLALDHPEKLWALDVLRGYVTEQTPEKIRRYLSPTPKE